MKFLILLMEADLLRYGQFNFKEFPEISLENIKRDDLVPERGL